MESRIKNRPACRQSWLSKRTALAHGLNVVDNADWLGVRILARVIRVEAIDIRHEEQVIGVDLKRSSSGESDKQTRDGHATLSLKWLKTYHVRGNGREGIVVTEFDFLPK